MNIDTVHVNLINSSIFTVSLFLYTSIPGGFGGLTTYINGRLNNRYTGNLYTTKAILEVFGGAIMATFISVPISNYAGKGIALVFIAFAIGITWSKLHQVLRDWITNLVRAALGGRS